MVSSQKDRNKKKDKRRPAFGFVRKQSNVCLAERWIPNREFVSNLLLLFREKRRKLNSIRCDDSKMVPRRRGMDSFYSFADA
ncbi:hypothetical protein DLM78_06615 [Leptospira stimsonii]|uniref:Uncharacterized protein n=1 Tax=Leptospira stimsonii TaxID=2202203 RepID=A0A8B3CV83_9LEPT|nr:hypothetical protein DLM78_06615 [Leptospira stimsonii]